MSNLEDIIKNRQEELRRKKQAIDIAKQEQDSAERRSQQKHEHGQRDSILSSTSMHIDYLVEKIEELEESTVELEPWKDDGSPAGERGDPIFEKLKAFDLDIEIIYGGGFISRIFARINYRPRVVKATITYNGKRLYTFVIKGIARDDRNGGTPPDSIMHDVAYINYTNDIDRHIGHNFGFMPWGLFYKTLAQLVACREMLKQLRGEPNIAYYFGSLFHDPTKRLLDDPLVSTYYPNYVPPNEKTPRI